MREPEDEAAKPLERKVALRRTADLLMRQRKLLTGSDWLDRDDIRRLTDHEWFAKLCISAPAPNAPTMVDRARRIAAFLVDGVRDQHAGELSHVPALLCTAPAGELRHPDCAGAAGP